jgi:TrmH family RNA methyltransferase
MSESALASVVVVLFEPQDPVNIAATVRAMKNMGLAELRLVRPVAYDVVRLEGIAHNTGDVIRGIREFDTFDDAVADCTALYGFTARRRAAKQRLMQVRAAAEDVLLNAREGRSALVFGREDKGLPNDVLDRVHTVVTIPTTDHASLNLAQAAVVAFYELHVAAADATREIAPPRKNAPPPTAEQFEQYFGDLLRSLEAIEFFKSHNPEHIMRTLRSLTFRAAPDSRELSLLRAVAMEIVHFLDRAGAGGRPRRVPDADRGGSGPGSD